jgi:Glycosyltransferase family 87
VNGTTINNIWVQRLQALLTRPRLLFFFSAFLLAQVGIFFYLESVHGILDRNERVKGRDFLQFYLAGYLVTHGQADRLYDQDYFFETQLSFVDISEFVPRYPSVYPPMSALLFSPFVAVTYEQAIVVWWIIQLLCIVLSGVLLYRQLKPDVDWKLTAILGIVSFYPVLNTFWNGQLSALLLLVLVVGLKLCEKRPILAGIVLSILALKPQLLVGVMLWFIIRRHWRVLFGICLGGLLQLAIIILVFDVKILLAYLETSRVIAKLYPMLAISVDHQHALVGILAALFGAESRNWVMCLHLATILLAGWFLIRIVRKNKTLELAAGIPFALLTIPHLLTYDLTYLLIPVAVLLSHIRTRPFYLIPATLIYASATLSPLYTFLGCSLVPLALLLSLYLLARSETTNSSPSQVQGKV